MSVTETAIAQYLNVSRLGSVVAAGLVAACAVSSAAALGSADGLTVSKLKLPSRGSFYSLAALDGRLLLSASDTKGSGCLSVIVNPTTLRIGSVLPACQRPPVAAEPVIPIVSLPHGLNCATLRIARPNRDPFHVSIGPVVMRFNYLSDTRPEWAYGPGELWVYDVSVLNKAGRRPRAQLLDVSTATGRVVRKLSTPSLIRPLLAADADGLWIAASPSTGAGTPSPLYHVAIGARTPRIVHRGGYATLWLVAAGHTVWADIGTLPARNSSSSQVHQQIWRFDGPAAHATLLASADRLNSSTAPAVQENAAVLWTVSLIPSTPNDYEDCTRLQLVRINADTGKEAVIRTLRYEDRHCLPVQGQAFVNGAFFFLGPYVSTTDPTFLYRIGT